MNLRGLWVLAFALLVAAAPQTALAHAVLVESTPKANAVVSGAEVAIALRYNSRVDAARSNLTLVQPGGAAQPLAIEAQRAPQELTARARNLKPGTYAVRWQVLARDGHITRGEVPFHVH